MKTFPRTQVESVSLPRLLMGSNWVLGYSHTSTSADAMIKARYADAECVAQLVEAYLEYGIDAVMGPFEPEGTFLTGIRLAEERTGKQVILIDTPPIDVTDSEAGRREARRVIARSREMGCTFCMPHHSSAEQLVNKHKGTIERLPDYMDMIRQQGLIPGLSAHMPELILYSDANGYDVQTYVQIFNCAGFLMQVEIEYIAKVIHGAKKPVMTIKPMAAGRVSPYVGLTFSFATIRPCDMVTLGAYTPKEVHEDVEIALAAIERRFPDLEGRASPVKTAVLGGKDDVK